MRLGGREGHAEVTGVACVRDMGRCQALMSVEAASGGSPDDDGRTHRMQRGLCGAREGAAAAAATLLPARQSAARHRPECCSSCAPQHLRLTQVRTYRTWLWSFLRFFGGRLSDNRKMSQVSYPVWSYSRPTRNSRWGCTPASSTTNPAAS